MRRRLVSALVVATMATGVAISPARPAQAALTDWFNVIIAAVQTIASHSGGGPNSQLEAAKREIINAVESAKQEILNHVDAIAGADVKACTESAVTKFAQIDALPPELLGPFVNGAVDCATLSVAYFNAVQDLAAADNIGKLMGVIYSIAMASFTKYGLSIRDLLTQLIGGYENVVAKLKPTNCTKYRVQDVEVPGFIESWWECFAYNGNFGRSNSALRGREPDRAQAEDRASANTSRKIAQDSLPQLRAALATAT
jgi:hypothetical protein